MRFSHRDILVTLLLTAALLLGGVPAFAANTLLDVNVDGTPASFQALSTGNLAFLPARDMANLFGADVAYDAKKKELTIKAKKTTVQITVGSSSIRINNRRVLLDASPMIVDNVTYVPAKAAQEIWGARYGWNAQTFYLSTDGSPVQVPPVEKVFLKRAAVTLNGRTQPVTYVLIPADSGLQANVVLAQNVIGQTESLSSIAARSSAQAAINGSYFQSFDETRSQDPYGILIKNGALIHAEGTGSAVGFTSDGSVKMDIVRSDISATVAGKQYSVSLMNHAPAADSGSVTLFTSTYGASTRCAFGTSVTVSNGKVLSVTAGSSVRIPHDGFVLLFTGKQADSAQKIQKGAAASYSVRYTNLAGKSVNWSDVQTAVGAGPLLLKDGVNVLNPAREGFTDTTGFDMEVARSAVGVTSEGDILLVSGVKCVLKDMVSVLSQLDAVQAICMDSGSFAGIYAAGSSAAEPAKEISNALIFK